MGRGDEGSSDICNWVDELPGHTIVCRIQSSFVQDPFCHRLSVAAHAELMAVTRHASEWARNADQELTGVAHHFEFDADSQICVLAA
jgi:hypothetical protein